MAEIKSTLELAMEKASRLEMDEGEERELRLKTQVESVLGGLKLKPSGEPDTKRIQAALSKVPDDLKKDVEREVLKNLFRRLELSEEDLGVVELAREVAEDEKKDELKRLKGVVKDSLEKKEELGGQDEDAAKRLESKGVSGSAVVVPSDESSEHQKELEGLLTRIKSEAEKIAES